MSSLSLYFTELAFDHILLILFATCLILHINSILALLPEELVWVLDLELPLFCYVTLGKAFILILF